MPTQELAIIQDRFSDQTMVATLKETVCKGATDAQFRMFIEVCRGTGLNPFLKEVWFVPGVGIMAGRDGYLRVANEHPQFDGMETLVERDASGIPIKATCKVWRKDRTHPITCEAYYNEYKKSSQVWTTYKSAMVSKVAEVLALKRSFSINGVVTEEEIGPQEPKGSHEAQQQVAQELLAKKAATRAAKGTVTPEIIDAPTDDMVPILEASIEDAKAKKSPPAWMIEMLQVFADSKKDLADLDQEAEYYRILGVHGVEKSNQFRNREDAKAAYREIRQRINDLRHPEPVEAA